MAIVGAGFTGLMLAVNLLRAGGTNVTLFERGSEHGLGVAYGAAQPEHLLNVRASNMSAFADRQEHLSEWLAARGYAESSDMFARRRVFGEYLRQILEQARSSAGDRLRLVTGEAVDIEKTSNGVVICLSDERRIVADVAALAVGNLPPLAIPPIAAAELPPGRYVEDPWSEDVVAGLADGDTVLILGTGLTMVDQALLLDSRGFRGKMVAISRRGLLPRSHAAPDSWDRLQQPPSGKLSQQTRQLRDRARQVGWRNAVDELRPFTQAMWQASPREEQARFIRHLRAWWDVHRHRIAPEVAERINALQRSGKLEVHAGRLRSVRETGGSVEVEWTPRGADAPRQLHVQRIINCTGPATDLRRTPDPLLRRLAERGSIRPDPLGMGIDVADGGRTVDAGGEPNEWLLSLGPMSRGAYWEIVAVPDIRVQVAEVAQLLGSAAA